MDPEQHDVQDRWQDELHFFVELIKELTGMVPAQALKILI